MYAEETYTGNEFKTFLETWFTPISNSGTQNCGVYIPKDEFYTENNLPKPLILICNHSGLEENKKEFLQGNIHIYVQLYREYKITELNENQRTTQNSSRHDPIENKELYYYLWQKMDGDVRQLFSVDIPSRFLEKNVEMELFTSLSSEKSIPLFANHNSGEEEEEKLPDSIFQEVTFLGPSGHHPLGWKELNTDLENNKIHFPSDLVTTMRGKMTWYCLKRQHDIFEKKADLWRRVLEHLETKHNFYSDKSVYDWLHRNTFRESFIIEFGSIMSSIEDAMTQFIEQVSNIEIQMDKLGWSFGDIKFDNVVYKHDKGKYTFRFIDPDSTLKEKRWALKEKTIQVLERIENKYQHFQYHDQKPNVFQSNFLSAMFTLIDLKGVLIRQRSSQNIDDFFGNWALTDFKPNIMNVLPFVHRLPNADILKLFGYSEEKSSWIPSFLRRKKGGKSLTRKHGHMMTRRKRSTRRRGEIQMHRCIEVKSFTV